MSKWRIPSLSYDGQDSGPIESETLEGLLAAIVKRGVMAEEERQRRNAMVAEGGPVDPEDDASYQSEADAVEAANQALSEFGVTQRSQSEWEAFSHDELAALEGIIAEVAGDPESDHPFVEDAKHFARQIEIENRRRNR